MKPEDFELIETLDRAALERHPVWKTYRPGDRAWVLSWGVEPDWLDGELERFGYCGPEPLFPVLEYDPLPERSEIAVAVELRLASGQVLPGYLLEPLAFGVFAGVEYTFNRGLPRFALRNAERLASELGISRDQVFPIHYRSGVRDHDGRPLEGQITEPW
jgi:hypothetical protein